MSTYSTDFIKVEYSKENECLYSTWLKATENATWDDIRTAFMDVFLEAVKKHKPRFLLNNEQEMNRPHTPEEQEWIDKNSAPIVLNSSVEKIAVIISQDGFVELASESMMEEEVSKNLNFKFFDNVNSAEDWLFN
ncbi:hypothetical protein [Alkalitalea saponilacus]|uniref:SpoIIAA-like n=1 Tax=Alkalitalea saponilacus TaxID=889453 RepID=A0A1T5HTK4_9BACT|nr:hypothetical protein [Alkalitalea saponilacus]ASB49169.1 hypothetical protein CDL62_08460 [Alkalitalea saponilacus]SKC24006.1 hypothetical protein SAMN03080601_03295 [Alkalitalea saponilacus]